MSSDSGQRSSLKSYQSASLISTVLDSKHQLDPCDFDDFSLSDIKSMGRVSSNTNKTGYLKKGAQHKRTATRKVRTHFSPERLPNYHKRIRGGPSRAPGNPSSNMEFLRGIYAFMQVSRSSINHVKIDSAVFRLHTNATVLLLITFSIAVTTRQYVGNPIDCVHTRDIPEDVLNTYCWIHSTYTVVDAFMRKQGSEVPFPGVDNSQAKGSLTIKHTKYYQWVAFTLFFQVSKIKYI